LRGEIVRKVLQGERCKRGPFDPEGNRADCSHITAERPQGGGGNDEKIHPDQDPKGNDGGDMNGVAVVTTFDRKRGPRLLH